MTIEDLRTLDKDLTIDADVCLIGSGPAGWAIAQELKGSGLRVLILESGGSQQEASSEALNEIECVGVPLFNGRHRTLGGTPEAPGWGGRCRSLDDLDYQERPWVPFSGWPFGSETIAPYLNRASEYLGAAPYQEDGLGPAPKAFSERPPLDPGLLQNVLWHFGREEPNWKPIKYSRHYPLQQDANVRVLVHATVTHLNTNPSGEKIESVEVTDPDGRRATVRASTIVLCAGGVENARILLYSNRLIPKGLGNAHDLVGRFLMDHPLDPNMIVSFNSKDADWVRSVFGPYKLDSARGRRLFIHGIGLSPERQRLDGLLNCAAWPLEFIADDDPVNAAKRIVKGPRDHLARDVVSVLSQPKGIAKALHSSIVQRQSVRHKVSRIGFIATSEQRPDPDSRIQLSERRDWLGLPITRIDWRINEQEQVSQAALAQLITKEFQRLGLPQANPVDWVLDRTKKPILVDACHPTGTTRMADTPQKGVVDRDCQVHGVAGLYVAGTSVFPTGGQANPTLMIVALAVRLAQHLKKRPTLKAPEGVNSVAHALQASAP